MKRYGTMTQTISLLGVPGMKLLKGQRVELIEPTNLPATKKVRWFARPADGKWSDGVDRNPTHSILIDAGDVRVEAPRRLK